MRDDDFAGTSYFLPDAYNLPFGVLRVRDGDFKIQLPANVGLTAFLRVDELVVDCEIVDIPRVLASVYALARATFVAVLIPGIVEADLQYTPEVGETGGVVRTQQAGRGITQLVRVALATADCGWARRSPRAGNLSPISGCGILSPQRRARCTRSQLSGSSRSY